MSKTSDSLAAILDSLSGMNEKLLQLSAEVGTEHPTGRALIKELLGGVQTIRTQIQEAVRQRAGDKAVEKEVAALRGEIDRLRLLLEVAEHLHSTLDTDEIATRILDRVLGWVGAERGLILVQDMATGEHLVRVGRELNESEYQSSEVAVPRTVVGLVLKLRRPMYYIDVQADASLMAMASVRDLDVRSLACVPLMLDNEILGVIYFDYRAARHRLGDEECRTLEAVCRQAALALSNANRYQHARERARRAGQAGIGRLIGTSKAMRGVFELVNQVALTPSTSVLITGASGTGKELVARAIHDLSSRASEPFIAVNCAALPPTLLESELFGYEKGAFTDARTRRIGLIEQADGGTLFLDEIGELSTALQSKMLRFLEERTIWRLGGDKDIDVDVRVVAATNRDIEAAVKKGEFRDDLFYRLNVFPIGLPALKYRGEDVVLIANAIIEELNGRLGTRIEPVDSRGAVAGAFRRYDWPGNVRELRNVLERAMILCAGRALTLSVFPPPIGVPGAGMPAEAAAIETPPVAQVSDGDRQERLVSLKELEDAHIDAVLSATGGNRKTAAEILGIDVSTLWRKLKARGK